MRGGADDTLTTHITAITRAPLLTAAEEIHLGHTIQEWIAIKDEPNKTRAQKQIERRGRRAKERMILGNMRLVISIARSYRTKATKLDFEDLLQEGAIGLHRAAEKYDPTKGYKFSTYATWWIRQSVKRGIEVSNRTIRLPVHSLEKISKARKYILEYQTKYYRDPPIEEVADFVGCQPSTMTDLLSMFADASSFDVIMSGHEDGDSVLAMIGGGNDPMDQYKRDEVAGFVEGALNELDPEQAQCISMLYGLNYGEHRFRDIVANTDMKWCQVRNQIAKGKRQLRVKLMKLGAQRCLD